MVHEQQKTVDWDIDKRYQKCCYDRTRFRISGHYSNTVLFRSFWTVWLLIQGSDPYIMRNAHLLEKRFDWCFYGNNQACNSGNLCLNVEILLFQGKLPALFYRQDSNTKHWVSDYVTEKWSHGRLLLVENLTVKIGNIWLSVILSSSVYQQKYCFKSVY